MLYKHQCNEKKEALKRYPKMSWKINSVKIQVIRVQINAAKILCDCVDTRNLGIFLSVRKKPNKCTDQHCAVIKLVRVAMNLARNLAVNAVLIKKATK
jgi:hypothetical protein